MLKKRCGSVVAGATAIASHPICRVCAGLGHLHHPFTAELVDRFVEEHPSLTKGQVAYAHAAAKFEVLRAADLEVDERCDNPGGGVERGSQIVIHQWLGEGSEERVHLARKTWKDRSQKSLQRIAGSRSMLRRTENIC
jgi:hypothetical protein